MISRREDDEDRRDRAEDHRHQQQQGRGQPERLLGTCRFSICSVKIGTNAGWSAASANRLRIRFGTWKAIVNADIGPVTPK